MDKKEEEEEEEEEERGGRRKRLHPRNDSFQDFSSVDPPRWRR